MKKDNEEKEQNIPPVNEQLPPLPPISVVTPGYWPGIFASITRYIASTSSLALYSLSREIVMWWFRFPVKLFRPYSLNPYHVFDQRYSLEQRGGNRASYKYMWKVSRQKGGWQFLKSNVFPLFGLNSLVGVALFNGYTFSKYLLQTKSGDGNGYVPFAAGAAAGSLQALLATPLQHIQVNSPPPSERGVLSAYRDYVQSLSRKTILFKGLRFNISRDALGYSVFFGVFENLNKTSKSYLGGLWGDIPLSKRKYPREYLITSALLTLISGAFSATSLQLVFHPLDKLKVEHDRMPMKIHKQRMNSLIGIVRQRGVKHFYQGFSASLLKILPASSLGLLVYESSLDYFQPPAASAG